MLHRECVPCALSAPTDSTDPDGGRLWAVQINLASEDVGFAQYFEHLDRRNDAIGGLNDRGSI